MALRLRNGLAPQMEWESIDRAAEDAEKIILPCLDRLFCNVMTMVVERDQLVSHVGGVDFGLVCH